MSPLAHDQSHTATDRLYHPHIINNDIEIRISQEQHHYKHDYREEAQWNNKERESVHPKIPQNKHRPNDQVDETEKFNNKMVFKKLQKPKCTISYPINHINLLLIPDPSDQLNE